MANIFSKLPFFRKKKQTSVELIGDNTYPDWALKDGGYQVLENHMVPLGVDVKSIKAAELRKYPLLNDPFASSVIAMPFGRPPDVDRQTLMQYVKTTPEIVAIFNAIIEDIISDGYTLEVYDEARGSGKNTIAKAEKFLENNHFKELLTSALWDVLGTGDAYIWKGKITHEQVRKMVESLVDGNPIQMKSAAIKQIMTSVRLDEDIFSIRSLDIIPSSTVNIKYDHSGVIEYIQRVGMNVARFAPEEVVHVRLWRVDGKIYGFTPLQSITREIDTLASVKDRARYFIHGGAPPRVFNFPNETPESPSVKAFKKALAQFAALPDKYKNIVVTGELVTEKLSEMKNDMEFKELAVYLTQVIVMAWQIPSSRLSDMLVAKGIRGATIATQGYYRKISHLQDMIQDFVNAEILSGFKVRLKFRKAYLEDEIQETQVMMYRTDTLSKMQGILGAYDKKMTLKKTLQILDVTEDDVEDGKVEMFNDPANRQNFEPNKQLLGKDPEKSFQDKDKQKIALQKR